MDINSMVIPSLAEDRKALITSVNFSPIHQSSRTVETLDVSMDYR